MKKITLTIVVFLAAIYVGSAQILPSFQFGAKAGVNLSNLSNSGPFNNNNQAGYLAGFWARVGALGFNFQPELYLSDKDIKIEGNGLQTEAKFTSIDVPLLFGGKVGAFGFGARFYTGPVISFAVNKNQNYGTAASDALKFDYKNQNYAWQIGTGIDIRKISFDLRYEAGLSGQSYGTYNTKINLFNLSLGYRLF
jgi:hypothetical protein